VSEIAKAPGGRTILHGDSLEILKTLEPNSIDSVVTDPPYGLSFMGKKWDYEVPTVELWREVLRVLKPGGHLLSFGGTRTYHRLVVNIEDAGFEVRDQIGWCFGSGFPKSHNLDGAHKGFGTALKPAWEPICVARKPLAPKHTVAQNVQAFGTGALNIDASRVGTETRSYSINGAIKGGNFGNRASQPSDERETATATGRWPANILFDEEAARILDLQSGTLKSGAWNGERSTNKTRDIFGDFNLSNEAPLESSTGGASRFFYVAKASKAERNKGLEGVEAVEAQSTGWSGKSMPKRQDGTERKMPKNQNHHPTVKPVKLMEYLVRLVTPPGGVCLDPFMGSGTTGVACKNLGFEFVGIERDENYVEIARKRVEAKTNKQLELDDDRVNKTRRVKP